MSTLCRFIGGPLDDQVRVVEIPTLEIRVPIMTGQPSIAHFEPNTWTAPTYEIGNYLMEHEFRTSSGEHIATYYWQGEP